MISRRRIESEKGFTLIELMVVILIIGILAAIALPAFLGQRAKSEDGAAKANVRNMVSEMEICYTEAQKYDPCPFSDSGLPIGTGPGEVQATPSGDTYVVVGYSRNGNTFTETKNPDGSWTRECDGTAQPHGGCDSGQW